MKGQHDHDHDHHHSHGGVTDPLILSTEKGIAAVKRSFWIFVGASLLEAVVAALSGSVALLADAAHNLGDTCSSLPLWLAFRMARLPPSRRFTHGYGRVEDFGGLFVVILIVGSAVVAGGTAIDRLLHPRPVLHTGAVMVAAVVSFFANEAAAVIRLKAGREIGSAALTADGQHARADGFVSLGVALGAVAVRLGWPKADPVVALLMAPMLAKLAWESGGAVVARMIDAVDPEIVEEIERAAAGAPGVTGVPEARARWSGHRLLAEVSVAVSPGLGVEEGHRVALDVRHRLLHAVDFLADATVHVCAGDGHRVEAHAHDDLPPHSHR